MRKEYKWPIKSCNKPTATKTESFCKSTTMNLIRHDLERMIRDDGLKILAEDYSFYEWDFEAGFVLVVFNPSPPKKDIKV